MKSAYVLSGEWEESGVVYGPGAFFFAPRGERHGPHVARTEVISLTIFDGPLTWSRERSATLAGGARLCEPQQAGTPGGVGLIRADVEKAGPNSVPIRR